MRRRIETLPQLVADQIAAGEVVERPASVLKELLDNAIDAGAKNITLRIEGSGVELVEVQDDGHGMTLEDARLATRRHATSKLRELSDLANLGTMGFRGEALASIAAVSKLELLTRTVESIEGTRIRTEGGVGVTVEPSGAPVGTLVRVRDLFFNVPARRKFLKSKATENQVIAAVVRRVALAHPDVRVRLLRDGRDALAFLPVKDAGEHLKQCFPQDHFTRVEQTHKSVRMLAWLGDAEHARSGSSHIYLFVNERPIADRALVKAIGDGFHGTMPAGRVPCGAVFLTVPTHLVDINVHPQKAEVRFADELGVVQAVTSMVASHHYRQQLEGERPAELGSTFGRDPGFWDERLGGLVSTASVPKERNERRKREAGAGSLPDLRPGDSFGTAKVSDGRRVPSVERPHAEPPRADAATAPTKTNVENAEVPHAEPRSERVRPPAALFGADALARARRLKDQPDTNSARLTRPEKLPRAAPPPHVTTERPSSTEASPPSHDRSEADVRRFERERVAGWLRARAEEQDLLGHDLAGQALRDAATALLALGSNTPD